MSENRFSGLNGAPASCKEVIGIETNKIMDACRDRDCYENVNVFLTDFGWDIVEHTSTVRTKSACIASAVITIDTVQFNKGFYTVNIRFYIKIVFEACTGCGRSQEFDGIAVVEKKVILYGGESNVNIFKSNGDVNDFCSCPAPICCSKTGPGVIVEAVDPIVLNTKVIERTDSCNCCCCCCSSSCDIPENVTYKIDGILRDFDSNTERILTISLGMFSIIRIVRPAQYLINAAEYCVPDKECVIGCDNDPCSIFNSMAFPTSEFCSTSLISGNIEKRCGC